ncbi:hypothetical protein V12B01_10617 [Vibrio splendidus 12B01]|nr:hypothetical protein V12B01_10617 [Vibrio splendidus 12B01]OCH64729.1 hypothetical protein A6D94_12575 [Vibrio splendidus]
MLGPFCFLNLKQLIPRLTKTARAGSSNLRSAGSVHPWHIQSLSRNAEAFLHLLLLEAMLGELGEPQVQVRQPGLISGVPAQSTPAIYKALDCASQQKC